MRDRLHRLALVAILGGTAIAPVGCSSSGPEQFVVQPGAVYAEAVAHEFQSTSQNHVIVLSLPTPGFLVEFEGTVDSFVRDGSYITVRRPPSGEVVAQVVVRHAIDTRVPLNRPVAVFARTVNATQDARGVVFQFVDERGAQTTE